MKDNYQKIESNFGQITIFKNSDDKNSNNNSIAKSRRNLKSKKYKEQNFESQTELKELETKKAINKNDDNLNYFDEQLVGNYFEEKQNEKAATPPNPSSLNTTSSQIKTDDLDYIDDFYFKPQKTSNLADESKNITKNDLDANDQSLNYIDQMTLKNITRNQDDDMIGSIEGIYPKQPAKQNDNTIPIIHAENLSERNEKATKKNFNSNSFIKNRKKLEFEKSDHKKLNDEVPKWDFITKDEAVNILKSHVCYYNEERMYCLKYFVKTFFVFLKL